MIPFEVVFAVFVIMGRITEERESRCTGTWSDDAKGKWQEHDEDLRCVQEDMEMKWCWSSRKPSIWFLLKLFCFKTAVHRCADRPSVVSFVVLLRERWLELMFRIVFCWCRRVFIPCQMSRLRAFAVDFPSGALNSLLPFPISWTFLLLWL